MKKEDIKQDNIKNVEFEETNYFSPIKTFFIGYRNKKLLAFNYSSRKAQLFDGVNPLEYPITKELWENFLNDLIETVEIQDWKKNYINSMILDGYAWKVTITSHKNGVVTFYGQNDEPESFLAFTQLIELVKEKIGIEEEKEE
jgi:hypothetical protein